jgi:hypothetical protein
MKVIFAINCHKNPEQVYRLAKTLVYNKSNVVLIHVDKKANRVFDWLAENINDSNIILLKKE